MEISGKVAIITGGADGLGKAFGRMLLLQGAKVSLLDVNKTAGETTLAAFQTEFGDENVIFFPADVCNEIDVKRSFEETSAKLGAVDIMINNAGILQENNWEKTVEVNLKGTIRGTEMAVSRKRKDTGGTGGIILNVASAAGINIFSYTPTYCGTKHGIVQFTKSFAEFSETECLGVRFICLCPAAVDTNIIKLKDGQTFNNQMLKDRHREIGKMAPEFVAEAVLRLLKDEDNNGKVVSVTRDGTVYLESQ